MIRAVRRPVGLEAELAVRVGETVQKMAVLERRSHFDETFFLELS